MSPAAPLRVCRAIDMKEILEKERTGEKVVEVPVQVAKKILERIIDSQRENF